MASNSIGSRWLCEAYSLEMAQPLPVTSRIGKARSTEITDGLRAETYPETYRPGPAFSDHLAFALKHEGVHLEFLARLFASVPKAEMEAWVNREPSGQYARRAGFFYEWLTGGKLDFPGVSVGNYVSALPEQDYLTCLHPINWPRWRVRCNLPGRPDYCPTVRRTEKIRAGEGFDCLGRLKDLEAEFGDDLLMHSAVWLTLKESRASFQIEHEEGQTGRVQRFASVMERRLGEEGDPLREDFLAAIQGEILGVQALRSGSRKSPVFIGESGPGGEVVHYVAPHWSKVPKMMEGLREFASSTQGRSSLLRAAVLSFGFVFIHPLADGNGRISRFLVNDTLRRDGAVPAPYILPISAAITQSAASRLAYERALERFSRPFMQRYAHACSFGPLVECEDGVKTNFSFAAYQEAQPSWSFPDLTLQAEYLSDVIQSALDTDLREEAGFLLDLRQTRARVKEVIEAPDVELDRMIRSVRRNGGAISGKLRAEFPVLEDEAVAASLSAAIMEGGQTE